MLSNIRGGFAIQKQGRKPRLSIPCKTVGVRVPCSTDFVKQKQGTFLALYRFSSAFAGLHD